MKKFPCRVILEQIGIGLSNARGFIYLINADVKWDMLHPSSEISSFHF